MENAGQSIPATARTIKFSITFNIRRLPNFVNAKFFGKADRGRRGSFPNDRRLIWSGQPKTRQDRTGRVDPNGPAAAALLQRRIQQLLKRFARYRGKLGGRSCFAPKEGSIFRELESDAEISLLRHDYFLGSDSGVFMPGFQYIGAGRNVGNIEGAVFIGHGEIGMIENNDN